VVGGLRLVLQDPPGPPLAQALAGPAVPIPLQPLTVFLQFPKVDADDVVRAPPVELPYFLVAQDIVRRGHHPRSLSHLGEVIANPAKRQELGHAASTPPSRGQ